MHQSSSRGRLGACALLLIAVAAWADEPEEESSAPSDEAGWSGLAQLGAGYDSNANVSTRQQGFLGFTLDPRFVQAGSGFGELSLALQHTGVFGERKGINSTLQLAHRANPDAPFANQTVAAIGTEAVLLRGGARFAAGVSAFSDWLDHKDYVRGANFDFNISYQPSAAFDTAFTVRTSRISYAEAELEDLDVDRYLAGLALTRLVLGAHSGSVGFTFLRGRDAPRREGSAFGNDRYGAQLATSWKVLSQASFYTEISAMHVDYAGVFFGMERQDEQYEAAVALEFTNWPAAHWSVTPQVRYERSDSALSLFEYERTEAAVYVRRQF